MTGSIDPQAWTDLLAQAAEEHHVAFAHTDGDDPEWPAWYAGWLRERIPAGAEGVDEASLARLLEEAAQSYQASGSTAPWPEFYAQFLLEQLEG